ncbi:MAG: hypothetical protein GF398_01435 [Chitinivibrionales bacterium]|nr:hypothetical protein [Chitinivibrionales bacterium]
MPYLDNGNIGQFRRRLRGLINELVQEEIRDSIGEKLLMKMQRNDRKVTGFDFRTPTPLMAICYTEGSRK